MDINEIVSNLREERDRINEAIQALEGTAGNGRRGRRRGVVHQAATGRKPKRRLSAAAKKRLSESAKARWAKAKRAGKNQL
jgi:hypothetical protein